MARLRSRIGQPPQDAFLKVNGRRWRRSDPSIPLNLRREIINELMSARRAVALAVTPDQVHDARRRVHDAKVALGERGHAWWLAASTDDQNVRIDASIRALLRSRRVGATICPSEPARIVGATTWRALLGAVRERAAQLAESGEIDVLRNRRVVTRDRLAGVLRYRRRATPHEPANR